MITSGELELFMGRNEEDVALPPTQLPLLFALTFSKGFQL